MNNLFVYGSLMFDDVWEKLVKGNYKKTKADLDGYKRLKLKGDVYPGLIKADNRVSGILIFNVKERDLRQLDRFEGKYYKRLPVRVTDERGNAYGSETYVVRNKYRDRLANREWDIDEFRSKSIKLFLLKDTGF